jgi:phosphoribosyl 1,2-cyclic phosphodiesterase
MILTCLASGSSGNCYVLKDSKGKMLLLDAGTDGERYFRKRKFTGI